MYNPSVVAVRSLPIWKMKGLFVMTDGWIVCVIHCGPCIVKVFTSCSVALVDMGAVLNCAGSCF